MLETIAVSFLTVVAKKVFDSVTSKATGQFSDAVLAKLKGDPTKKAFKRALGEAVQRYATGERLYLAAPLLADPGVLGDSDVAKELSCLIGFEREPNTQLIAEHWKVAIPNAHNTVDFN